METLVVELTHKNALQLLKDLEAMDIIRLHDDREAPKKKLSEKYRGILPKEAGEDLINHVNQMRGKTVHDLILFTDNEVDFGGIAKLRGMNPNKL